jgi:hypothetical protein
MKALIREAFLHIKIIGNHVVESHYNLLGPDGGIVLPTLWEELIEPGWSVSMHMWPMLESPPPNVGHFLLGLLEAIPKASPFPFNQGHHPGTSQGLLMDLHLLQPRIG